MNENDSRQQTTERDATTAASPATIAYGYTTHAKVMVPRNAGGRRRLRPMRVLSNSSPSLQRHARWSRRKQTEALWASVVDLAGIRTKIDADRADGEALTTDLLKLVNRLLAMYPQVAEFEPLYLDACDVTAWSCQSSTGADERIRGTKTKNSGR